MNHSFSHIAIDMEQKNSEINERKKDTFNRIVPLHVKDLSKIDAQSSGSQLKLNYTHSARTPAFRDLLKIILCLGIGFSNGWKETFMSGDQEPWVFRGGLTADLQRLIPVDSGNDLFVYKAPEVPNSKIYTIRPYLPSDEEAVFAVCNQINNCTTSSAVADKLIGGFLTLNPELCMVVEDENGITGYAVATLNVKSYNQKIGVSLIPELRMKYPLDNSISELPQNIQDAIQYFHSFIPDVSEQLCRQHPSKLVCGILPSVTDQSICKRLITCVLAALRANGSFGVHTTMAVTDKDSHEFYGKLGFVDLNPAHEEYPGIKTMCRSF